MFGSRYCGDYHFYTPALIVRDPNLIKQIAVKDFDHFMDHFNFFPSGEVSLWEKNLFFLKGVNTAFHFIVEKLKHFR